MILCQCTGLTDREVDHLLQAGVRSVAELARRTGAGATCGPCRAELAARVRRRELDNTAATKDPSGSARLSAVAGATSPGRRS